LFSNFTGGFQGGFVTRGGGGGKGLPIGGGGGGPQPGMCGKGKRLFRGPTYFSFSGDKQFRVSRWGKKKKPKDPQRGVFSKEGAQGGAPEGGGGGGGPPGFPIFGGRVGGKIGQKKKQKTAGPGPQGDGVRHVRSPGCGTH